ncbi:site-specific integrase [Leptotrichia sp. OH3620_COT-345]|uniref:tyrosine-type recombinase/integrase n=1 Tax=Leptotrichia sp. OH3620_COT-345 TaxID=2491048 RepID=UPI000F655FDB|nr:tyrosine-type recombinase/integrase [Leptotrichia sp. OH3620_COT-345]RRD40382.1 site-specific integrase [Leptotrichia sp. OH3620_COT-345]
MRNANGTGSVYKRKEKSRKPWIVREPARLINGKYKRPIIGSYRTQKEAQEMLREYNSRNLNIEYSELKLVDLFNKWKISKHAKSIKTEETFNRYCRDFTVIFEEILEDSFISLDYSDYQNRLNNYPKNKGRTALTVLKSIYVEAMKQRIVKENISLYLESSDQIIRTVDRVIFKDEFVRMLWENYECTNNIYVAMVLLLFYTGMRSVDLFRIENENINLKEKYLITGSKTEAGINRRIPIHNLVLPIVKKYMSEKRKMFFEDDYGTLKNRFNNILKEYDVEGNLHSIRHTFITKMRRIKDVPASKVKNIVGHKVKDITDGIYTHWSIEELRDVINKLVY